MIWSKPLEPLNSLGGEREPSLFALLGPENPKWHIERQGAGHEACYGSHPLLEAMVILRVSGIEDSMKETQDGAKQRGNNVYKRSR